MNAPVRSDSIPVYLGIGSNIEPATNLPRSVQILRAHLTIESLSSIWGSPSIGAEGPDFHNAVLLALTWLPVDRLRNEILRPIETQFGRIRTADPNSPRPIDLDILLYAGKVIDPTMWEHAYQVVPLAEINPDLENPTTHETAWQIAQRLASSTPMRRLGSFAHALKR